MSLEDRIQAAADATACTVGDIRPLVLPARAPLRLPQLRLSRRWTMWMAPVTAAAVVTALAVGLVSARDARTVPSVSTAAAGSSAAATLPAYYVALDDPTGGKAFEGPSPGNPGPGGPMAFHVGLAVGDTRTGKRLVTLKPPRGQTFIGVTGAADDRTFVVAAASSPVPADMPTANPDAWYLLRLAPGSARPATLTKLPIPGQPSGTPVYGIALSPDGSELAVMYQPNVWQATGPGAGPLTLRLYSIPSGHALRTWTQVPPSRDIAGFGMYFGRLSNTSVTWLPGGHTLAFADGLVGGVDGPPLGFAYHHVYIYTLDVTRPSGNLLANSKPVLHVPDGANCETVQLTADGKSVLCGVYAGNSEVRSPANAPKLRVYSVATGKSRLVYQLKGSYEEGFTAVLWASPDGSTVLAGVDGDVNYPRFGKESGPGYRHAGIIAKGTFTPIQFPLHSPPYMGEIAF